MPYFILGVIPRNKTLLKKWNFTCQCRLCMDCTENGSYYSALKCDKCETGHLLPQMSADIWQCDKCRGKEGAVHVKLDKFENFLHDLNVFVDKG